jgi:hypothetical protein
MEINESEISRYLSERFFERVRIINVRELSGKTAADQEMKKFGYGLSLIHI